ncbi:hypothetical protein PK28_06795 [Hymenobacter sp. DG25B]|nr:hypothetical protein PK28_06795 [Hymenobacter sp. DG25B]
MPQITQIYLQITQILSNPPGRAAPGARAGSGWLLPCPPQKAYQQTGQLFSMQRKKAATGSYKAFKKEKWALRAKNRAASDTACG